MFATRSIVHALIPNLVGLGYGFQPPVASSEPLPLPQVDKIHKYKTPLPKTTFSLILAIYIENLLTSQQLKQNWKTGTPKGKTLQFQRKVRASFCATPVSKLAHCPKTGTIGAHKYNRFQPVATFCLKTGNKTGTSRVSPFHHQSHK